MEQNGPPIVQMHMTESFLILLDAQGTVKFHLIED